MEKPRKNEVKQNVPHYLRFMPIIDDLHGLRHNLSHQLDRCNTEIIRARNYLCSDHDDIVMYEHACNSLEHNSAMRTALQYIEGRVNDILEHATDVIFFDHDEDDEDDPLPFPDDEMDVPHDAPCYQGQNCTDCQYLHMCPAYEDEENKPTSNDDERKEN